MLRTSRVWGAVTLSRCLIHILVFPGPELSTQDYAATIIAMLSTVLYGFV
ncbi:MAG: hypothetical protein O2971_07610 [Proteobacteria bacterium]|nr:hypothetical protein [Pseudomonadota bacterium]